MEHIQRIPRSDHRASAKVTIPRWLMFALNLTLLAPATYAQQHMRRSPMHTVNTRDSDLPLQVTNNCDDDVWPAILTQGGTGPGTGGFQLSAGESKSMTVSADWKGRVWARTNCSFDGAQGSACSTGDCGQNLECQGAGNPPATLAEFTYASNTNQAFYDISLVDGYNVPMGVVALPPADSSNSNLTDIPPNWTNPICIGSAGLLTAVSDTSDAELGTNSSYPIPLDESVTTSFVAGWCPFPLLTQPPQKPGDGIYPYPDDNIQRPLFSPCLSACAKWNLDQYCCTGSHDTPDNCKPSYYSTQAKKVCPDAYSYAYDDQTSTFIIPQGLGFEVVICPKGRSSTILSVFGDQLSQLAQTGHVTRALDALAQNRTYIAEKSEGVAMSAESGKSVVALVVLLAWLCF